MMTAREKQLVRHSFPAIREVAGPVSKLFYGRLFELQPELRRMFQNDIGRQGLKLMEMLSAVVQHVDGLEALNPVLEELGKRHVTYGVNARQYDTVEQALLWSMAQALEADFDHETRAAWRKVIGAVSTAMQRGAEQGSKPV